MVGASNQTASYALSGMNLPDTRLERIEMNTTQVIGRPVLRETIERHIQSELALIGEYEALLRQSPDPEVTALLRLVIDDTHHQHRELPRLLWALDHPAVELDRRSAVEHEWPHVSPHAVASRLSEAAEHERAAILELG